MNQVDTEVGGKCWCMYAAMAMLFFMATLLVTTGSVQAAEKFPTRAINVVVGFAPGGLDVPMRAFIDRFQEVLKQPVKYEFKVGASGAVAAAFVANQKPDGYTLLAVSPGQILNTLTMDGAGYTMEDFVPICRVTVQHSVIVVKSDSRWKTLKDLIEDAKKSPDKLTYSAAAVLGTQHLPLEMLQKQAGFKITFIPSGGSSQTVTAILGGHVDFAGALLPSVAPHLKSGALRGLAQISNEPHPDFPDIPTLRELGYRIPIEGFAGLLAPKGLSKDVLATLTEAADRTVELHGKTIAQQILKMNAQLGYLNSQDFGKRLTQQRDDCKEIIDDLKKTKQK